MSRISTRRAFRADNNGMTMWLIAGGMVTAAWAMLSVVGGELTQRTDALRQQYKAKQAATEADDDKA